MRRLLVIGAGGHGRSVAEAALASGAYHLSGFLDDAYPALSDIWGFPVFGTTADLASHIETVDVGIVAVGNGKLREQLFGQLEMSSVPCFGNGDSSFGNNFTDSGYRCGLYDHGWCNHRYGGSAG